MTDTEAQTILKDAARKLKLGGKFFFMAIREGDQFCAIYSEKDTPKVQKLTHAEIAIDDRIIHFYYRGVPTHAI